MNSRKLKFSLLILLVFLFSACDRLRGPGYFIERAQRQVEAANYKAAIADLKTALSKDESNTAAQLSLVEVFYRVGDYGAAQDYLDALEKSGFRNEESNKLNYQVMLALNKYSEVLKKLESDKIIKEVDKFIFSSQAFAGLGQYDSAMDGFAKGLALNPKSIDLLIERSKIYIANHDLENANKDIEQILSINPSHSLALYQKALVVLVRGDSKTAREILDASVVDADKQMIYSDQVKLYALLSELSIRANNASEAKRWIHRLEVRAPYSPLVFFYKARQSLLEKKEDEAIRYLQQADSRYQYIPAQILLSRVLIAKKSYEQAEEKLNILVSKYPNNDEIRKLLSGLYMETNRYDLALKTLPAAKEENSTEDPELQWLRGRALFSTGSRDTGLMMLEKAVADRPENYSYVMQLARAYLIEGHKEKAINLLNALPKSVGSERDGLLVLASVIGKTKESGENELKALLSNHPQDAGLHSAAAALIQKAGELELASSLYEKAIKLDPKSIEAHIGLAALKVQKKDYKSAEYYLTKVLSFEPKQTKAALTLAAVYLLENDKVKARKQLELLISNDPTSIEARFLLANIDLSNKDYVSAKKFLDQAVVASDENGYVINQVGNILYEAQRFEDALTYFERATTLGVSVANISSAKAFLALGRQSEARKKLEVAAKVPETQFSAVGLMAKLDIQDNKLNEALERIGQLSKEKSAPGVVEEMYGDAYASVKDYEKASARYALAYKQSPSQSLAIKQHEARLEVKGLDPAAPLKEWLKSVPDDLPVIKLLAGYMTSTNKKDDAIKLYEQILSLSKTDLEVLNNLAWLYLETNNNKALATAEAAYLVAGNIPEVLDTYGIVLLKSGRQQEALAVLSKATELSKNNSEISFHYAKALSAVGDKAKAKQSLEKTLASKNEFPSLAEAKLLYQRLQ